MKEAYGHFIELLKQTNPEDDHPDFDSIIEFETKSITFDKIAAYAERLDCTTMSSGGHAFFNGKHLIVNDVGLRSKFHVELLF